MLDETIPIPADSKFGAAVARRLNALRPIAPAGSLAMYGPAGTGFAIAPKNLRDRRPAPLLHPWKVFAVGMSEGIDHCFEIYVPEGSVHVGEDPIVVDDLTPIGGKPDHYRIDCEDEISGGTVIFLAIVKGDSPSDGGAPASAEDEQPKWKARIVSTPESIEDEPDVLALLPLAMLSIDDSGEFAVGKVDAQYAHSSVAFTAEETNLDKVSIDKVTKEDAEDPSAIQIKDFDNEESDGGQGLAERLEVEKVGSGESATYKIKAKSNKPEVHLVARVNGKIKYIPLSGKEETDPDEEDQKPQPGEECQHDPSGNAGGVSPRGGGGGGTRPGDGGVKGDCDSHTGDDNCNCNN